MNYLLPMPYWLRICATCFFSLGLVADAVTLMWIIGGAIEKAKEAGRDS